MTVISELLAKNIGVWTEAVKPKASTGRGGGSGLELYGVKKLRYLILDLAITGNLTDHPIEDWCTATLGEIGSWGSGGTPLKAHSEYYGGEIPWLVIGDLNDGLVEYAETHITPAGLESSSAKLVPAGTLLIAMYGSIGKLGIAGIECATNQAIAFCNPNHSLVSTRYLFIYLMASRRRLLSQGQGLAQQNISQKILKAVEIQLPSLHLQDEIVAKVDELMALCDKLEAHQADVMEAHKTLVTTVLDALTKATEKESFDTAWARIAKHFDILFTTEWSVDQLKQTILQLAVMGRLVSQDESNECAKVAIERGKKEKADLIKTGKIKNQPSNNSSRVTEPYGIPAGWSWEWLSDVAFFQEGPGILAKDFRNQGVPLIRIAGMGGSTVTLEGCNYLDPDMVATKWSHFRLDIGDTLLSASASLGKVSSVDACAVGAIPYTGLIRFKPYCALSDGFMRLFFSSPEFKNQIDAGKSGATIKHFGPKHLKEMLVPVPPLTEQGQIVKFAAELTAMCEDLISAIRESQETQLLLADAITEQAVA